MKTPKFESLYEAQNYEEIYQLAIEAINPILSASQNQQNEKEEEIVREFCKVCDFDLLGQEACNIKDCVNKVKKSKTNPPKEK